MTGNRLQFVVVTIIGAVCLLVTTAGLHGHKAFGTILQSEPAHEKSHAPTVVHIGSTPLRQGVLRLGVNVGGQSFYDSREILKNLVSRNPGFEGQEWQSVIRCRVVTPSSCTDGAPGTAWPDGFLDGGTYEGISGSANGQTGTILHSTKADSQTGSTIEFARGSKLPAVNDYFVVRKVTPGGATAGWWPNLQGGATAVTEFNDLSPASPGKQALRLKAAGPGQYAEIDSFFDSTEGRSFVHMRGLYVLRFRARGVSGNQHLQVRLSRPSAKTPPLFDRSVSLSPTWQDYSFTFEAADLPGTVGTASLAFSVYQGEVLLDDVSLEAGGSNGTAFRDEVVAALYRLRPGVLRDMDSGQSFGSSLESLLSVPGARRRAGFNKYASEAEDIPVGIHDFLVLAEKIGAEPWYTVPIGMSQQEARDLMEYLGGSSMTPFGARRAALGHPVPWTETFPVLHIEFGNEAWNDAQPGAAVPDPKAYAERASSIFRAMRSAPEYRVGRFDLIANGQAVNPYLNRKILAAGQGFDTIDVAPYLFSTFVDDQSPERIFGPMLAQPEMLDSSANGIIRQQAVVAAAARPPVKLAVYETGINTSDGTVGQGSLDAAVPSIGAGLAAVEHMLLMLRDLGITVQSAFHLGGYWYRFENTRTHIPGEHSRIWGMAVDMGGLTNRVRPSFLAQEIANQAIRPTLLTTTITGEDPTWDQPLSANDKVELKNADELQTFAFTDGTTDSIILFNLSRTAAHSLTITGERAPRGLVQVKTLTSAQLSDSNEDTEQVKVVTREERNTIPAKTAFSLPPFSMTVLLWAGGDTRASGAK